MWADPTETGSEGAMIKRGRKGQCTAQHGAARRAIDRSGSVSGTQEDGGEGQWNEASTKRSTTRALPPALTSAAASKEAPSRISFPPLSFQLH